MNYFTPGREANVSKDLLNRVVIIHSLKHKLLNNSEAGNKDDPAVIRSDPVTDCGETFYKFISRSPGGEDQRKFVFFQ